MKKCFIYYLFFLLIPLAIKAQEQAHYNELVVEGINEMMAKNHLNSLEILSKVQVVAKENDWPRLEFLAVNNIGANYYQMLNYGLALENYLEAYKIALKSLDTKYEMTVLNNIAILYSKEKAYDRAEEYFDKAFQLAYHNQDSITTGYYAVNLAIVANKKQEWKKVSDYINIAYDYVQSDSDVYLLLEIVQAEFLKNQNQLTASKEIILRILPNLATPNLSEHRFSSLRLLASIYEIEKDFELALKYLKMALDDPQVTPENKIDIYQDLSTIYLEMKQYELALTSKDSLMTAKENFNEIKNVQLYENSRIQFELENYQKELLISQQKLKQERKIFYVILGMIILLAFLSIWAFRNYFVRIKQKGIIAENNRKIAELELEQEKAEKTILKQRLREQNVFAELEQEKLKNEIEAKNRQLASKALSILARNELIESIISSISKETIISEIDGLSRRILELKNHLKRESDWDDFFLHFEETNHGFLSALKLKHPELNVNDVRFLSYVYMNLSTKEISSLLNITIEACRKRKERIVKKMNLGESESLYTYISAI